MEGNENGSPESLKLSKEDLETLFENTFETLDEKGHKNPSKKALNTPFFDPSLKPDFHTPKSNEKNQVFKSGSENLKPEAEKTGAKSSLRLKYEAEVSVIKKTHGDLEGIRRKLKLSKRKMAQLLMVDPSAWTRWTSKDGEAPPHIYRALEWYCILQDKHPELKSAIWLNAVATPSLSHHEAENLKKDLFEKLSQDLKGKSLQISEENQKEREELKKELLQANKRASGLNRRLQRLLIGQGVLLVSLLLFLVFV